MYNRKCHISDGQEGEHTMALKMNSVKCPECGANLQIEEGRTQVFCSYCGTKIIITNENEHIYRHIDEADIRKAETDRMVRMRRLNMEEQGSSLKKTMTIIWMAVSLIIILICIIEMSVLDRFTNGFLMLFYLGGPVIGGGAYLLFKLLPEKENEKVLLSSGGIKLPKALFPYSDKTFEEAEIILRNAGFRNITSINAHDLVIGLFEKPGKIDSITVNGERLMDGGKVYMPNIPIVITYHGK